jgi:hypothetical protein
MIATMRGTGLVMCAVLVAGAERAEARPTVAIAGVEVATDSVGVDVEAVGVARELTQALRRAASTPDGPLQLIDPMVRADDVEALVWGKLLHDGDGWVVTVHLSAVGADGDTVSYRATFTRAQTSSVELDRRGRTIYQALLAQVDVDDRIDDEPPAVAGGAAAKRPPPAGTPPAAGTAPPTGPVNPFEVRDPSGRGEVGGGGEDRADDDLLPPATVEVEPLFARETPRAEPRGNTSARRLFWISAGIAGASALLWTYSAVRISDAEAQLERLVGCSNCDRAVEAANAQGNRWEGVSWLAGTATLAGAAAVVLFGYQGYVVGRRPGPAELVGGRSTGARAPARSATVTPVLAPDRVGASLSLAF